MARQGSSGPKKGFGLSQRLCSKESLGWEHVGEEKPERAEQEWLTPGGRSRA